jgi:hypothetical protein
MVRNVGFGFHILEVSRRQTHRAQYNSSGRVIRPSQRPLPDNTQQSQQIRTRNPSKQAGADLRLRPCGNRDRLPPEIVGKRNFAIAQIFNVN